MHYPITGTLLSVLIIVTPWPVCAVWLTILGVLAVKIIINQWKGGEA